MTQPIDVAVVEVRSDTDPIRRDLNPKINKELKKLEKNFDDSLDRVDKKFIKAAKNIDESLDHITASGRDSATRLEAAFIDAADGIDRNLRRVSHDGRGHLLRLGDDADDVGDVIERKFSRRVRDSLGNLLEPLAKVGSALGSFLGGVGGAIAGNPLLALIIALSPAILVLGAALADLVGVVGLLPSGFFVLLAAIAPLIIAFQNFGEAVSAVASGDLEKMNEALAKLAPSAQNVAKELGALVPRLKSLQRRVQEQFFAPLQGAFNAFGKSTLPALSDGLALVANSLGKVARKLLEFFSLGEQRDFFDKIFAATSRIVDFLGPNLVSFFQGFGEAALAILPTFERLATLFSNGLGEFGDDLAEMARNGELQKFVDDALATIQELWQLLGAVGGLLKTLFGTADDEGRDFIQTLTDVITRLDEWFKSEAGQKWLQDFINSAKVVGAVLGFIVNVIQGVGDFFFQLEEDAKAAIKGISEFFKDVKTFVEGIPAAIDQALGDLGTAIKNKITDTFNQVLFGVGVAIGLILFAIQELPGQIIGFLQSLPQRVDALFKQISTNMYLALKGGVDSSKNLITTSFTEIVDFIKSVPDLIMGLGPFFLNAGKNLIKSFMNGFRAVGSFIGDVAGDIVGSVKSFLNKAIDKINSGIASIDAVLPGDLGRIPKLAGGAVIKHRPGGILANVGEGSEDEVVAPLSKLEGMIQGSSQTINFSSGAIVLTFEGALPTTQQAFGIGQTVARGIASQLERRNVRAQVRAM